MFLAGEDAFFFVCNVGGDFPFAEEGVANEGLYLLIKLFAPGGPVP